MTGTNAVKETGHETGVGTDDRPMHWSLFVAAEGEVVGSMYSVVGDITAVECRRAASFRDFNTVSYRESWLLAEL